MKFPNKYNGYSRDGIRLYNDPVTTAVVGATAGAALSPKHRLNGALLGGMAGFGGGALLGAGAAGGAGLAAGGSALAPTLGTGLAAGGAEAAAAGGAGLAGTGLTAGSGMLAPGLGASMGAAGGASAAGTGLIAPTVAEGTIGLAAPQTRMQSLGGMAGGTASWIKDNPLLAQRALDTASSSMQEAPPQFAPAGQISRGQPMQQSDLMSLLNPQQSSVLRPKPISLR